MKNVKEYNKFERLIYTLNKQITKYVDDVKYINYMASESKKELEESLKLEEFCLRQLKVVVLQISRNDIHENVLIKRREIYVF
ncbi:hypothetical protein [Clostridium sp.]|uniref:hypothetical protein n=1 Tax=Clostridium sp. TaxID=1506 RepID=UPI0039E76856